MECLDLLLDPESELLKPPPEPVVGEIGELAPLADAAEDWSSALVEVSSSGRLRISCSKRERKAVTWSGFFVADEKDAEERLDWKSLASNSIILRLASFSWAFR